MSSSSCPADLLPAACSVSGSNLPPIRGRVRGTGDLAGAQASGVPAVWERVELCLSSSFFSCEVALKHEVKENVWIIYLDYLLLWFAGASPPVPAGRCSWPGCGDEGGLLGWFGAGGLSPGEDSGCPGRWQTWGCRGGREERASPGPASPAHSPFVFLHRKAILRAPFINM